MHQSEIKEAVQVIEEKLREGVDEYRGDLREIKSRLKEVEQRGAPGFGGGGVPAATSNFARNVMDHESFKAFAAGNSKNAMVSLKGSMFPERKNTVSGTTGSPPSADNTIAQADRVAGIVSGAFRQLRVRDLFPKLTTDSNRVEFTRESAFTNNAAAQEGEGATKAETDVTFELGEANVATFAHWLKVSRQIINDQPALLPYLEDRLRYGILLAEEAGILSGDGTGMNFAGLTTTGQHTDFSRASSGDTAIDTLRRAITQLELADWAATGIVVNPAQWEEIVLTKDSETRYVLSNPGQLTVPTLWGIPVVPTASMTAGEFLVMDAQNAGMLWDRQQPQILISDSDGTDFQKNLVTVLGEHRSAFAVLRPAAVIHGSF